MSAGTLQLVLFAFGIGFLVANLKVGVDLLRYYRRRQSALLIWRGPTPPFYSFSLFLGVVLTGLFVFKLFVQHRPPQTLLGEAMMSVYFVLSMPASARISRGFYQEGVWSDTGFMPWSQISAVSWRDEGSVTLMLISHGKSIARRLEVPGAQYGEARRVLLDRVKAHDIHIGGAGLNLGTREEGDSI